MYVCIRTYICMCVYDNSINTGAISSNFYVGSLGTLGQHELAFRFCGSIGIEISRVRNVSSTYVHRHAVLGSIAKAVAQSTQSQQLPDAGR